jgi:cytochrome c5
MVFGVRLVSLGLLFALAACGKDEPAPSAAELAARHPADARLDSLYQTSCKACHANPESGAPPVGYAKAWKPRLAKGEEVLLSHVVEGVGGMPAGGQCFSCTPDDYRALIRFLAAKD